MRGKNIEISYAVTEPDDALILDNRHSIFFKSVVKQNKVYQGAINSSLILLVEEWEESPQKYYRMLVRVWSGNKKQYENAIKTNSMVHLFSTFPSSVIRKVLTQNRKILLPSPSAQFINIQLQSIWENSLIFSRALSFVCQNHT